MQNRVFAHQVWVDRGYLWQAINPKVQTVLDWNFAFRPLILRSITGKKIGKSWDGGLQTQFFSMNWEGITFLWTIFYLFGLGQKATLKSFQLWLVVFFYRTFFLSKIIDIFRNLNHYQKCNDEKFRTIAEIKLWNISRS